MFRWFDTVGVGFELYMARLHRQLSQANEDESQANKDAIDNQSEPDDINLS